MFIGTRELLSLIPPNTHMQINHNQIVFCKSLKNLEFNFNNHIHKRAVAACQLPVASCSLPSKDNVYYYLHNIITFYTFTLFNSISYCLLYKSGNKRDFL